MMRMIDFDTLFTIPPYALKKIEKEQLHKQYLDSLFEHHYNACKPYQQIVRILGKNPPLPVRLFKKYDLRSTGNEEITKIMTSSGTSGQSVSKIYLDRATSARQTKALSKIVSDFTGKSRLPMLVIDSKAVLKNRNMFSARGAGILGFSMLGRDLTYALDENMNLDWKTINAFCQKYYGQEVLMFGFTYIIWQHFYQTLKTQNKKLPLKGILIHGGGWKKLSELAVSEDEFRMELISVTQLQKVLNYYGMVEQTGSIFMECECGHLHASVFSDIQIFHPENFEIAEKNEQGLVCLTSLLPTSYPGHILLTEDEGEILGEDDCPCGRMGKYFKIYGRMRGAELRGCSDTYEQH